MPVKECQINGIKGYKWGNMGKCYTGPNAKQKAINQGIAIGEYSESYTDYPKAATENAKIALRWVEENGWGSCGTPVGKIRANQLAKREPISRETIARMAAFERHRQNSTKELGDGCGRLMWLAWGGDEGIEWAQRKLKQIDKFSTPLDDNKVIFSYDVVSDSEIGQYVLLKSIERGKDVYIMTELSPVFMSNFYNYLKEIKLSSNKLVFTNKNSKINLVNRLKCGVVYVSDENEYEELQDILLSKVILIK